jgi:TatD DNase family protein
MYYDAHCHYSYLKKKYENFKIAAVSMDYSSSIDTLSIKDENILKGVAIHPWNVDKENIDKVIQLIHKADFVGEIGLDFKYSKAPKDLQIKYFEEFLEKSENKTVNIHALEAWKETIELLLKHNIKRAIIHWYSGPVDYLKDIEGAGYFITINPSVTFQEKHKKILEKAPLNIIITESDGGYEYKGKLLQPTDIIPTLDFISKIKEIEITLLNRIIENNFRKAYNI